MKIYFLYNASAILKDQINQKYISDIAETIFEQNVTSLILKECTNLSLGKSKLDYYCIIDAKLECDPLQKKRIFSEKLCQIMNNINDRTLNGVVKIQTGFNIDSDVKHPEKPSELSAKTTDQEFDYEQRAEMYEPVVPSYTFDRVILPKKVLDEIEESLAVLEYEEKVFKEWGLYSIQPNPSSALSFYGPSGTGKTMAAEAIANKLGKKILKVSYADIESKYHGEGPKMVKAIFLAAQKNDAVLFIDEADSLLSKRLTNVTQGSEQAINSMRSQLLICLEEFKGIVIFATNLVVNYDQAFLTRLINIEFVKPDKECRKKIWDVHIKPVNSNQLNIPLDDDVNTDELAEKYDFCGREIRKAVISACIRAAMNNQNSVSQQNFIDSSDKILSEQDSLSKAKDHTISVAANNNSLTSKQQSILKTAIKSELNKQTV